jgi:hypothetical protein
VIGPSTAFSFAAELSIEQGQSELRTPPQWDFSWIPVWTLCIGHILPAQHASDELETACATAAAVPTRRANSSIIARTRFMPFFISQKDFLEQVIGT